MMDLSSDPHKVSDDNSDEKPDGLFRSSVHGSLRNSLHNSLHAQPSSSVQDRTIGKRDVSSWHTTAGQWVAEHAVLLSRRTSPKIAVALLAICGLAVVGISLAVAIHAFGLVQGTQGPLAIDKNALTFMQQHRSSWLNDATSWYTDVGGPTFTPLIAVCATVLFCIRWRSLLPAFLMGIDSAGSLMMTTYGKHILNRVRPDQSMAVGILEHSSSFPSGHSINAVSIVGMIAYLLLLRAKSLRTRIIIVCVAILHALIVGTSRVYLGHHWLTDVITGWSLGLAWLTFVITLHRIAVTLLKSSSRATRSIN